MYTIIKTLGLTLVAILFLSLGSGCIDVDVTVTPDSIPEVTAIPESTPELTPEPEPKSTPEPVSTYTLLIFVDGTLEATYEAMTLDECLVAVDEAEDDGVKVISWDVPADSGYFRIFTESIVTSIIPANYYTGICTISPDVSVLESLTDYHWAEEYKRGGWDCSQMSAAMEQRLENCGYNTVIQMGDSHAWILIELPKGIVIKETLLGTYTTPSEGWYIYECTGRFFVTSDIDWDYTAEYQFEDIYAVEDFYNDGGWSNFESEWGWWM